MAEKAQCWKPELPHILDVLVKVAKEAGQMIASANPSSTGQGTKNNTADLVTETDQAVEKMVSTTLKAKFPTFQFLGEETYKPGMKLTSAPTFVVDPIDGTTNFVHGFPYVSISLGFAVDKKPVVGVVYNPFTAQMYTGVKGQGSHLTDTKTGERRRLPLKQPPEQLTQLSDALVAVEYGSDRSGESWETKIKTWANLGKSKDQGGAMVHSIHALGSAALNMCAIASGTMDVYWEGGCWPWDVCAGWVILTEAGGIIVDGNPGNWEIPVDNRKYLCVRGSPDGRGQKEIIEEFWSHVGGMMTYEC